MCTVSQNLTDKQLASPSQAEGISAFIDCKHPCSPSNQAREIRSRLWASTIYNVTPCGLFYDETSTNCHQHAGLVLYDKIYFCVTIVNPCMTYDIYYTFYYGKWRALHHHAACWLVNIHITWSFCPPVSMVKNVMESIYIYIVASLEVFSLVFECMLCSEVEMKFGQEAKNFLRKTKRI